MGYDVHITRAEDWDDNEGREIALEEWLGLIQNDSELIQMPESGVSFVIWRGATKYPEAWFDWYEGNIMTKYPDRATLHKMLQMATALEAKIQGDDGEIYDETAVDNFDDSYLDVSSTNGVRASPSSNGWWFSVKKLFGLAK